MVQVVRNVLGFLFVSFWFWLFFIIYLFIFNDLMKIIVKKPATNALLHFWVYNSSLGCLDMFSGNVPAKSKHHVDFLKMTVFP